MSSRGQVSLEFWGPGTVPTNACIVWCNFPKIEALGEPGPYSRPALVFKSKAADAPPAGRFLVLVAYGTTKLKVGKRPHDFVVMNKEDLDILRLPCATRFDLDRVLWLPWARPFFSPREGEDRLGATPVMSALMQSQREKLMKKMMSREAKGLNGQYHSAPAPVGLRPADG